MTTAAFDGLIHPPHRLQLCAMLASVESLAFATARESLGLSDSALSKQVCTLQDAGYLTVAKGPGNARVRTWLALTSQGRQALAGHLAELRRLADMADDAPTES